MRKNEITLEEMNNNLEARTNRTKRVSFILPETTEDSPFSEFQRIKRSPIPNTNTSIHTDMESSMMTYIPRDKNVSTNNGLRCSLTSRYKRSKRSNSRKNRFYEKRALLSSDPEFDYNTKHQLKLDEIAKSEPMFHILQNPKDYDLFKNYLDIDLEQQEQILKK
ncbi:hypothetical protein M0812_22733 [Anaeramoeba flamelloides]|uniref:Uncharacterized protein n=1 Tax=Anaeramoeba flamelloides TaxID=1746091 RepID=A0AAV7YYH1_9EUKA|nr:hypothetical protein M0812_22733 [Anaeramoeba flamelloides]